MTITKPKSKPRTPNKPKAKAAPVQSNLYLFDTNNKSDEEIAQEIFDALTGKNKKT